MAQKKLSGFTLIELILVMILLSLLAIILLPNFTTTLIKGRDAQRKNDVSQIQKALEMYYEENRSYPTFTDIFNKKLCTTSECDNSTDTIFMVNVPNDPKSPSYTYLYLPEPTTSQNNLSSFYYILTPIENSLDSHTNVSQKGFIFNGIALQCGASIPCKYYVSSSNAPQLTPNP